MRSIFILLLLIATCILTGCVSMTIGDIRVYGSLHGLSPADIRAAIAADQASPHQFVKKIFEIEIISRDEIHVYHARLAESTGYDIMQRIRGKWVAKGQVTITS